MHHPSRFDLWRLLVDLGLGRDRPPALALMRACTSLCDGLCASTILDAHRAFDLGIDDHNGDLASAMALVLEIRLRLAQIAQDHSPDLQPTLDLIDAQHAASHAALLVDQAQIPRDWYPEPNAARWWGLQAKLDRDVPVDGQLWLAVQRALRSMASK